jgi:WD40 repeat protein
LLHTLQGSSRFVNQIAYSPDGHYLASANFDHPVQLWDTQSGQLLHQLKGHQSSVRRLVFSPDSRSLATSGDGRKIWLWDVRSGKVIRTLDQQEAYTRTLIYSHDGKLLVAGCGLGYGSLSVWDVEEGKLQFTRPDVRVGLDISFGVSPDGRTLAYSDRAFTIHLVRPEDGTSICAIQHHRAPIETIRFSPDGTHLATQDKSGVLCLWQLAAQGKATLLAVTESAETIADFWNLVFSPSGQALGFQLSDQALGLLDVQSGQLRWIFDESLYSEGSLSFTAGGETLISGGAGGAIHQWDVNTGRLERTLAGESIAACQISVHPESNQVAGSGDDGALRIWDMRTGECRFVLRPPGPYEGMDITGAVGLSPTQVATLQTLGAIVA